MKGELNQGKFRASCLNASQGWGSLIILNFYIKDKLGKKKRKQRP